MVTTKREDVTKQGFCDTLKKTPSSGKFLISTYSIFGGWEGKWGWALIQSWALINFFCL